MPWHAPAQVGTLSQLPLPPHVALAGPFRTKPVLQLNDAVLPKARGVDWLE